MAIRAKGSERFFTAAMRTRSTSDARARGSVSGWRGMSVAKLSRLRGASAQPHALTSSRKVRRVIAAWAGTKGPTVFVLSWEPRQGRVAVQVR